ncbi:MAG: DUF4400 domain-containing protein [Rhodoferax sp.]|jgi:hypothetical protein|nr:DUF4400 domain-containing protein [Rhodoferax sp.]
MDTSTHIRFWILMILAAFLLSPLVRDSKSMESYVANELQMTRDTFGNEVADWLENKAALVYRMMPSDVLERVQIKGDGMRRTKQVVPGAGVAVTVAFNNYVQGLVTNLFVATLRMFIVMVWLFVLAPVFLASLVDGFSQRAIKRAEFGAIRPAAFALTSIMVVPMSMAPLIYLVTPMTISPLATPMWALLIALPLALMVSNMQPIFGRN